MDDVELLEHLLAGDEAAYVQLVTRYHASLVRVARYYVSNDATAQDVAQDTWIAVLRGLERFEGRSSLKTWLFRICVNRAQTAGVKERRVVPIDVSAAEASVSPSRFNADGLWIDAPVPFTESMEDALDNQPLIQLVHDAITRLPATSQAVVTLRDVEGLSTVEVGKTLNLSEANVRVILHRSRAKIRAEVEATRRGAAS